MNRNKIEGNWKQVKGSLKEKWNHLTNDDLERIQGRWEELQGIVQERYGHSAAEAKRNIREFEDTLMRKLK